MAGKIDLPEMDLNLNVTMSPIVADLEHNGTANINGVMDTSIKGSKDEPVAMMVLGDERQPISANITGDKDRPISMAIEMTNLPRFSVSDIKEMMKPRMKISLPGHRQLCLKVFGQELFSICYGGEGQLKIEPLNPEDSTHCHIPVCSMDTRPFPENPKK